MDLKIINSISLTKVENIFIQGIYIRNRKKYLLSVYLVNNYCDVYIICKYYMDEKLMINNIKT